MTARVIVTVVFLASVYTLGRMAGCSGSRPYGYAGDHLAAAVGGAK